MLRRLIAALLLPASLLLVTAVYFVAGTGLHYSYSRARDWSDRIYEPLPSASAVHASETSSAVVSVAVAPGVGPEAAALLREAPAVDQADPIDQIDQIEELKPFTILIMGVDQRVGDKGRTDALVVAAVNPRKHSTLVLSIPRDTRTLIADIGRPDKINHAYAYGGTAGTVAAVEHLLDVQVDYYFKANMEGFTEIVDLLGGIEVENGQAFAYEGYSFAEGRLSLGGDEALAYVRMRYQDPRGDLGRGDRQRAVLSAMLERVLRADGLFKLVKMFDTLTLHMKTNLTFAQWKTLIVDYRDAADRIRVERMAGNGAILSDIYYYIVAEEELARIRDAVAEQLREVE